MIGISDAARRMIVNAIKFDAGLASIIGQRAFDHIRDDALFPYVSIGPENWQPFESVCLDGAEGSVQIDIWSRAVGRVECAAILERVVMLFNGDGVLAVPGGGYRVTSAQVVLAQIMPDQGARARHGVVQVEMTIERDMA